MGPRGGRGEESYNPLRASLPGAPCPVHSLGRAAVSRPCCSTLDDPEAFTLDEDSSGEEVGRSQAPVLIPVNSGGIRPGTAPLGKWVVPQLGTHPRGSPMLLKIMLKLIGPRRDPAKACSGFLGHA